MNTIVPWADYGDKITLTCKNHPTLRWRTKNINHIGARTLYFDGPGEECDCPLKELVAIPPEEQKCDKCGHDALVLEINGTRRRMCPQCFSDWYYQAWEAGYYLRVKTVKETEEQTALWLKAEDNLR